MNQPNSSLHPFWNKAVIVAALGYFVDIYDLVLFSIVRIASLKDLGFEGQSLTDVGVTLLNAQMAGLLIGGILWGSLGDKRGRLSVLFGSIALYSIANLLNAFVQTKESYWILRFLAGIGLSGELGAAVTLVTETLPIQSRGYSTAFIASIGILGAIAAALVAQFLDWRMAYGVGGVMGLLLLIARKQMNDSSLFQNAKESNVERGNFFKLFQSRERLKRYLCTIGIGVPCWYVLGILLAFGPEITLELGRTGTLVVGTGVIFQYLGASLGDLVSGVLSQKMESRNKVLRLFLLGTSIFVALFLFSKNKSPEFYYALYFGLGFVTGYWAVFVTVAAEQFGTNLRATAASTAPNFVRGAVIPMTFFIQLFKGSWGLSHAVAAIGVVVLILAFISLWQLKDSYSANLSFLEA